MPAPEFETAQVLAAIFGVSTKTIHRRALREGWAVRFVKNRLFYAVPRGSGSSPGNPFPLSITDARRAELRRVRWRFEALDELERRVSSGVGAEAALSQVADLVRFQCSASSLRRWQKAFASFGLVGLLDHKLGRSGRKPNPRPPNPSPAP